MNKILVYDNVMSDKALHDLKVYVMNEKFLIANSHGTDFAGLDAGDCFFSTEEEEVCTDPTVASILEVITSLDTVKIDSLVHWYINLYPSGDGHAGIFHSDDACQITGIYFPSTIHNGGELEFEDGNKIQTKANRLVMFDSHIRHKANAHYDHRFRVSFAFKLNGSFI